MKPQKRSISITTKMIVVILASILFLATVLYVISLNVLPKSYEAIEKAALEKDLQRAHDSLNSVTELLREKLRDWAAWDDTYTFVVDVNQDYINENLGVINLANLNINSMLFANMNGEVVFKRSIDIQQVVETDATDLENYFESHPELFVHRSVEDFTSGLISLPSGPLLFASQPVLTSEAVGPIEGSLTFGKYINKELIDSLAQLTHLSIEVFPHGNNSSPEDVMRAEELLTAPEDSVVLPLSKDSVAAYTVLYDFFGAPTLTLKVEAPREVYKQGAFSLRFFMVVVSILFLVFGCILIILLKWFVVSRFTALEQEVQMISDAHNFSLRLKETSNDEIGILATAINGMLDKIVEAKKAEDESNEKVRAMSAEIQRRLDETEKMNRIMVDRELKMVELKKELENIKSHDTSQ
jgi:sensor domain CHASE-containing protein